MTLLVMSGWAMLLYSGAVIDWWIVPAVAFAVGLATGLHLWRMWRYLTGSQSMTFNYVCHAVFTAALLSFIFFLLNDTFSDRDTAHNERGVVTAHAGSDADMWLRVRNIMSTVCVSILLIPIRKS